MVSKDCTLIKVFGHFNRPEAGLFVELLTTYIFIEIKNSHSITADSSNLFTHFSKNYSTV
jgi:hypothetical protein